MYREELIGSVLLIQIVFDSFSGFAAGAEQPSDALQFLAAAA